MNTLKIVPDVEAFGGTPAAQLNTVQEQTKAIGQTISAVPGAISANASTGEFKVGGADYSVYANLSPEDQKRADALAEETNVRDDNTVTISTFGTDQQKVLSELLDKALDQATQFSLDDAMAATVENLTKVIDTGLDMDLVYNEDPGWFTKWANKHFTWFSQLNRFLRKTSTLRWRLAKIRKNLMRDAAELIGRMNLYDLLEDNFEKGVDDYYVYAAASELIFKREQAHLNDLITDAAANPNDGRKAIKVKRQETTVFATIKRMFYLLSQSLTCFLKVNVLEEGLRAASLAFGSVMEASDGAIDDLKAALTMILNQYRTSKIHQNALQVNHAALEALQKASALGKVSIAMMSKMTEEQKYAIGAYYKVGDDLVEYIMAAKQIMKDMKQNYNDLGKASDGITAKINAALAAA